MNRYHLTIKLAGQQGSIAITGWDTDLAMLQALRDALAADASMPWQTVLERETREAVE